MRIFVSSTCFDLIDVRSELLEHCRALGLDVVMSDEPLSDFVPDVTSHSIESCLVNLRACEHCIVLLSQRYGPVLNHALPELSNEPVSATHLEYLEAVRQGIPISFCVRKQLFDDFALWRSRGRPSRVSELDFKWTMPGTHDEPNAVPLFRLIDMHWKLRPEARNWVTVFRNSFELRSILQKDLRLMSLRHGFEKRIADGSLPEITLEHTVACRDSGEYVVGLAAHNTGRHGSYNVELTCEERRMTSPYCAAGEDMPFVNIVIGGGAFSGIVSVVFHTAELFGIRDEYLLECEISGNGEIRVAHPRIKRRYFLPNGGAAVAIELSDTPPGAYEVGSSFEAELPSE